MTKTTDETYSFRWGIPLLDKGYITIPNFFFDCYVGVGMTRMEFLTILHLARYQYEKPDSECRPSVETVACQMGYSMRGLQKVLAGMAEAVIDDGGNETRPVLLVKHLRPGKPTIYDFTGFSRLVLAAELSTGMNPSSSPETPNKLRDEPQFRSTHEPQFIRRRTERRTDNK